jgi:hypothetical protein
MLKELGLLHAISGDDRFMAAVDAIAANELIDLDCNWVRDFVPPANENDLQYLKDVAFCGVEMNLNRRMSLRLACAQFVAAWPWIGHSFEAAVKEVERLWRSYRAAGKTFGQVGGALVSKHRSANQE